MALRRESLWPSTRSELAYRLDNLRIALALLAEHVATTSMEIAQVIADPFAAERARTWLVFAARWTAWAIRSLRRHVECAELDALAARRREVVISATAVARLLGVADAELDLDDRPC